MSALVIVALPERDDRVWKLSSQKVPHMTLLFLGEDSTLSSDAVKYVEHVVSTMRRFFMTVDRRGVLGDDKADVLFFENHNVDWLENIRSYLLSNTEIAKLHNTSKQFDSWTPHLTLGYPDAPAKEDLDYGIYSVGFDRIAVWTSDFEGPEFVLPKEEDIAVAMRDSVEEALAHYGVKGMRWGVRNAGASGGVLGPRLARRKAAKKDKKWQKNVYSVKGAVAIHNHVADKTNSQIAALNARHPKADIRESVQSRATRAYIREYESMQTKFYQEAVQAVHGTSPSGTFRARYVTDTNGHRVEIERVEAEHAEGDTPRIVIEIELDGGHIGRLLNVQDNLAQSAIDDVLSHYGVKGMRWGVRRRSGGGGNSGKTKFTKPPNKLSDTELNRRISRLEREDRYNKLNAEKKSKGREFAEGIIESSGRSAAKKVATGAALVTVSAVLQRSGSRFAQELLKRLG